ncbi:hypothetical protein Tco_0222396 [Tanacetum coccineum]
MTTEVPGRDLEWIRKRIEGASGRNSGTNVSASKSLILGDCVPKGHLTPDNYPRNPKDFSTIGLRDSFKISSVVAEEDVGKKERKKEHVADEAETETPIKKKDACR